jgi:hypothetical protein
MRLGQYPEVALKRGRPLNGEISFESHNAICVLGGTSDVAQERISAGKTDNADGTL